MSGRHPVDPLRQAIARNVEEVRQALSSAAAQAGRTAPTLVAVTKAVDDDVAQLVLECGCSDLGENRADAFAQRARDFKAAGRSVRWHYIGHLQRNKVRRVLEHADVLHSVDSARLADAVTRIAEELGRSIEVFVQVNLTGEDEKHGFQPEDAAATVLRLSQSPAIKVRGLMAMGPLRAQRTTREVFEDARELANTLESEMGHAFEQGRCELSMGMSGDAALAAELGSDVVRVGSALYRDLPRLEATEPPADPQAPDPEDAVNGPQVD